jgi:hypothetical protein
VSCEDGHGRQLLADAAALLVPAIVGVVAWEASKWAFWAAVEAWT